MKLLLLILFSIFSQSIVAQKQVEPVVTQKQVEHSIHYWQHVLRLDDLDIYGLIVPLNKLPDGTTGASKCAIVFATCEIRVLQPSDYAKLENNTLEGQEILNDIENTIVHELVHIRLRKLSDIYKTKTIECITTEECTYAEEYVVVRITSALLNGRESQLK